MRSSEMRTKPRIVSLTPAQRVAAEVIESITNPITLHGHNHTQFACCEAPRYALEWSIAEAEVARRVWARLAEEGVIPRGWIGHEARRFGCPLCFRAGRHAARHRGASRRPSCVLCRGEALDAPCTLVECVTLASDPEAVCAVEGMVSELAETLRPWGARPPAVFVWRVRAAPRVVTPGPLHRACVSAALALRREGEAPASVHTPDARRAAWRAAVACDAWADATNGVRFGALRDPWALLDELNARGFALEALTETDAVLCATPVPLGGPGFGSRVRLTGPGASLRRARTHGDHG